MRNIVQIKKIDSIHPIEGADAIEAAHLGGWVVVVKKNEFKAGDSVLYFEIDSFLPGNLPEFEFLLARGAKTVHSPITNTDVEGHVLKTARLRGTFSQGLILPLDWGLNADSTQEEINAVMGKLGVFKWEPPVPTGGAMIGVFPRHVMKTDSERVQNLSDEFLAGLNKDEWFATEKIDGISATFTKTPEGEFIIASRNWALDPDAENVHSEIARRLNLKEKLPNGAVIQGEIFGEGAPVNPLKVQGLQFGVFNSEGIEQDTPLGQEIEKMRVPRLDLVLPDTIAEAVDQVFKMKSTINPQVQAEGVVWWNEKGTLFPETGNRPNFKAINNQFLLKHGG